MSLLRPSKAFPWDQALIIRSFASENRSGILLSGTQKSSILANCNPIDSQGDRSSVWKPWIAQRQDNVIYCKRRWMTLSKGALDYRYNPRWSCIERQREWPCRNHKDQLADVPCRVKYKMIIAMKAFDRLHFQIFELKPAYISEHLLRFTTISHIDRSTVPSFP